MRKPLIRLFAAAGWISFGLMTGTARADVCVVIDEVHDALLPAERTAAVLLVTRQFEAAGERGVDAPCPNQYSLSHIRLGETIYVTLSGPKGHRERTAIGLDDLPAVYSQMTRSLITGQPMTLSGVVDRTNVSVTQADNLRADSDSIFYARLGYGMIFTDSAHGAPAVGLIGYRHELDSFAIDVSFLNFQNQSSHDYYGLYGEQTTSSSWLKLEGLYFKKPSANQTPYVGGGLSWNTTSLSGGNQYWGGSGLQGEVTVGYEMARASTIRLFVQADAGLPFYRLVSTTYARTGNVTSRRYAPSLTVSLGLGWQRSARYRR